MIKNLTSIVFTVLVSCSLVSAIFISTQASAQSAVKGQLVFSVGKGAIIQDISILVLKEAYQKIGIDMKVKVMPNARALKAANKGLFDGDVSRIKGIEKKFTNLIAVPVEINYLEAFAFSNNEKVVVDNWDSLKNYRVVSVLGIKFVENNLKKHGIQCNFVPSFVQAMTLVERGRADVAIFPNIVGLTAIKEAKTESVKMLDKPLIKMGLYHYINKKHEAIAIKLTTVLEEMKDAGRVSEIRQKYMKDNNYI